MMVVRMRQVCGFSMKVPQEDVRSDFYRMFGKVVWGVVYLKCFIGCCCFRAMFCFSDSSSWIGSLKRFRALGFCDSLYAF